MFTIKDIVGNISKGQSALGTRLILKSLEEFYLSIKNLIEIKGCKKEDNNVTVYFNMPSKTTPGIAYDIVLKVFDVSDKVTLDTKFQIYSNSPGFGYNFVYVMYRNGSLLFPAKYPGPFIQTPPKMRNPNLFATFDKHCFAAFRFISQYELSNIVEAYDGKIPTIKTFNDKVAEIANINDELRRART